MRASWVVAPLVAAGVASAEPMNGTVITHLFPYCGGRRVGGFKPISVPPDTCLSTHGLSYQVINPAVCANGTQAKLARFPDAKCNKGEIVALNGLEDIEIKPYVFGGAQKQNCFETGDALRMPDGTRAKQGGMVFWCDPSEKKKEEEPGPTQPESPVLPPPQAQKASVSHNSCWGKGRPTAPVFPKISHDTCVNLDAGKKLEIYRVAVCPGGSKAQFAQFHGRNCRGSPELSTIEEDRLQTCMTLSDDEEEDMSYAFWCEGPKETKAAEESSDKPQQQGSIGGLVVILCMIFGTFLLIAVLTLLKWASFLHRVLDIFGKRDGGIRL